MSSAMHKAKMFLGFAAEEDEPAAEVEAAPQPEVSTRRPQHGLRPVEDLPRGSAGAEVTHMPRNRNVARVVPVREEEELRRITTIEPSSYNDAKIIGEHFRDGVPVILNLSGLGEAEGRRLVDFSAGLTMGLRGKLERVTTMVFLLSPETVEVVSESKSDQTKKADVSLLGQD